MPYQGQVYEAIVVGAGPAGIAVVGNLLERRILPVFWIDNAFDGGRISRYYREVPSNLKVKKFLEFATELKVFQQILMPKTVGPSQNMQSKEAGSRDAPKANASPLNEILRLDPEQECSLSYAADLCLVLTQGLANNAQVTAYKAMADHAEVDEANHQWTVFFEVSPKTCCPARRDSMRAKRFILCTGSSPKYLPLTNVASEIQHLSLDIALSPSKLANILHSLHRKTIAVIGGSHSAVLVLENISNLVLNGIAEINVRWFVRHELRYAEYENGRYVALDNTGLKGETARWARRNLEADTAPDFIKRIIYRRDMEQQTYSKHLPGVSLVVQAIGYERSPLPSISRASTGADIMPCFDWNDGTFSDGKETEGCTAQSGLKIPGMYGVGIAFPARIRDPKYGHTEMSVGFPAFMKAVKHWLPHWT